MDWIILLLGTAKGMKLKLSGITGGISSLSKDPICN
jgi:hypothetical protein